MATVMEKVRPSEARQLADGVKVNPIPLEIMGMEKAMLARYDSMGNLKGGFGSLVEKKGRFWFYQHGCLYYKNANNIFEIHGDIYKKWIKLGGARFGRPDTNESPCVDGTGRFNHFENNTKTIFWHPSTGANAVWGDIKVRWNELGWERSYLGYPTSDEVDFPDGGRVNAFQNGGIYWWPDTGAMDINDVVVHYTGLMCFKETGEIDGTDEPYAIVGVVSPFGSGAYRSRTYASVDSNTSRPDLMEKIAASAPRLAFHPPCTLQHGQQLRGGVEQHLGSLGFDIRVSTNEAHLCCGSAGTYSVLQPEIAYQLRDRKLANLGDMAPEVIVSANIGCIAHLQSGTATPVRHWVEVLDEALLNR